VLNQIASGNRDPQVFWHEPTKRWVAVLYAEINHINTVQFLSSPNLKDWTVMSHTDGFAECPNFFELPVDGDVSNKKWVLTGASSEYMVGRFDGTHFTPETEKLPGHRGKGFYAAQTFSDIPSRDGRRIQIGWMQAPTPGMPFNQSMSIPFELKLTQTPEGPRLARVPVKELKSLRRHTRNFGPATIGPNTAKSLGDVRSGLVEVRAEFKPNDASAVALNVRGATIVYDTKNQQVVVNGLRAPAPLKNGKVDLWIYCDRAVMEVFASDGLTYIPMPFIPKASDLGVRVVVEEGSAKFSKLEVHELESAWK
jgi:sucrose-6-phosphate hydrolase SacC (GH32 family)